MGTVTLQQMQEVNAALPSVLPPTPVAVFTGATKGIGLYTLRTFVRTTTSLSPRIYFVGRTATLGNAIVEDLKSINPKGEYIFLPADVGLLRSVDEVCATIAKRETYVNVLFMSQGTLAFGTQSSEGLDQAIAVTEFSRVRFAQNLMPLIARAEGLRRVVSCFAGTKEGALQRGPDAEFDWEATSVKLLAARGHTATMQTLFIEYLARTEEGRKVAFLHCFPGVVHTDLFSTGRGVFMGILSGIFRVIGPLIAMGEDECGARMGWMIASGRFVPAEGKGGAGVAVSGDEIARGTDGAVGSGAYTVDEKGLIASQEALDILAGYRNDGTQDKLWEWMTGQFKRVCG